MRHMTAAFAFSAIACTLSVSAHASDSSNESPPAGTFLASVPSYSDFSRADEALRKGDYVRAARIYSALADGTRNPFITLRAGFAHLGAGKIDMAEVYFRRGLRSGQARAIARQGLGLVAISRGDRKAARSELEWLERAAMSCSGQCSEQQQIESAAASLRRAIG